jgi:hypothetical protein
MLHASAGRTLGHAPKSEEEFKEFIKGIGAESLERMHVKSIDDLFISPRDGKPYVVIYGKSPTGVLVYESEGVDGLREVGFQTGQTKQLNNEQFNALGL